MRRLIALATALLLLVTMSPAYSSGPDRIAPGLAKSESAQAAQEKASQAKEASQSAARGAAQAAQEASSAAREAAQAERQAPGSGAEQARAAAQEKAELAKQAGVEAREKAKAAANANREAALARAAEKSNGRALRALNKVKAAKEPCVEYLEDPTAELAAECEPAKYLVRFNNGVDAQLQARAMRSAKFPVSDVFDGVISGALVELTAKQLATVAGSGRIRSIEEDFVVNLAATQSNPEWGLDRIDQPNLPLSASYTNANPGTGVKVYVVDTGIRNTHAELAGRVDTGFSSISDGLGTLDCNAHGTHVAGIAAGTRYGVAKQATLVPVRVLGCQGEGTLSGVLAGLDWIINNHAPGTAGVVNMSLGGLASDTLDAAVQSMINRGITVVVAAGNSSSDACLYSPARVPAAITVAASSRNDAFASFSNSGSCVDISAPGVEISSAVSTSDTAVAIYSGTSMASPHVAGTVASIMTAGYLTPAEVNFLISQAAVSSVQFAPAGTTSTLLQVTSVAASAPEAADGTESGSGSGSTGGGSPATGGTIDLPEDRATAPIAPIIESVNLWRNAVRVNWQLSADGGSPITSQIIRIWERGQLVRKIEVTSNATSLRIAGLRYGVSYTFTVLASNAIGTSDDSLATRAITPVIPRR